MFDLRKYMSDRRALVEEALRSYLPPETEQPSQLHRAMRYSVLSGGKRLRPIICLLAAEAAGGSWSSAIIPAVAIECVHAYTLVHDDLPLMDNDDLRHGKPTTHKVFGEANALLAGDALLAQAFDVISAANSDNPARTVEMVRELAIAASSRGVVGGQYEDLAAEGATPEKERLAYIHLHKTASLIRAACRIGAIAGGADPDVVQCLGDYGERIGLAFQMVDDILNATSTPEALGKAVGSDVVRRKMTYVSLYGVEEARHKAVELVEESIACLNSLTTSIIPLVAIARFVVQRPL